MDKFLELKVIITFSIFVFFLIIERLLVYKEYKKKKRLISNFSLWFINGVSSYFIILPLTLFFTSLNFWERNTSVIQIVINLFVLDLWTYWWHRINHIIPLLWRFHLIHHLDEHLDATSALRFHFGEVFLSVLARGILIIGLAIPFSDILIFETLLLICAIFHHSNLKLPKIIEKPLSLIIVTPNLHWIHHHKLRQDTDSNYGLFLSVWDRIFASKSKTLRTKTLKLGVEGYKDSNIWRLLLRPFTKQ